MIATGLLLKLQAITIFSTCSSWPVWYEKVTFNEDIFCMYNSVWFNSHPSEGIPYYANWVCFVYFCRVRGRLIQFPKEHSSNARWWVICEVLILTGKISRGIILKLSVKGHLDGINNLDQQGLTHHSLGQPSFRWIPVRYQSLLHSTHNKMQKTQKPYIDGVVQNCSISIANTLDILQYCTKPSVYNFWDVVLRQCITEQ